MKQIARNDKSGELIVLDAPVPAYRPGGILVQSLFSLISTGTEMMKVAEAKMSMVGKARARPDQARKVLDTVAQQSATVDFTAWLWLLSQPPGRLVHIPASVWSQKPTNTGRIPGFVAA
jgi:hypothetical protein